MAAMDVLRGRYLHSHATGTCFGAGELYSVGGAASCASLRAVSINASSSSVAGHDILKPSAFSRSQRQACRPSLRINRGGASQLQLQFQMQAVNGEVGENHDSRATADQVSSPVEEEARVEVEISPFALKQVGNSSGYDVDATSSLIARNEQKRKQQQEKKAGTPEVVKSGEGKLESHLAALDRLLGPRPDKYATSSSPSAFSPSPPASHSTKALGSGGGMEKVGGMDERIRYGKALLNKPAPSFKDFFLDLDMDTAEWWYPRAVLLWTTFVASVARMKDVDVDPDGETMDRETTILVRALLGDIDPKEALERNFPYAQSPSEMVSGYFVGADGRQINEEKNPGKEWLFLADMYSELEKRPGLLSVWEEKEWLVRNVFEGSSFKLGGDVLRCQHGLLFFGTITGDSAAQTLEEMQERLKKNYFFHFIPILLKQVRPEEEVQCLICSPQVLPSLRMPKQYENLIFLGLSMGVTLGASQIIAADPGLDSLSLWEQSIVPLSLLAVLDFGHLVRRAVASAYNVSHQVLQPWFLPVPHQGALASFTPYVGCLPNRKCLLDLSIFSSLASLSLSALLIFASSSPLLSPQNVTDFRGFLAVPSDLLAYSGPLTWLMNHLSIATSEAGAMNVISPWALAGVLGLHITAMGLLPIGLLDGGRIFTGLFGREWRFLRFLLYVTVAASLGANGAYVQAAIWSLFVIQVSGDDWYQLDEVTEPNLLRKIVSGILLLAGTACFFVPLTALQSIP